MALHARHQFPRIEWLRQIIVGAEFQPDNAVFILAARRQHQHRQPRLAPHPAQDLEAVHARQHDIQNHQVETAAERRVQPFDAVVLHVDTKPFAGQQLGEQPRKFLIIIHNKDSHNCNLSLWRARRG